MITRREVDEFVLQTMQAAFLALRESNRADESQTVLLEMQQAMQMLPAPISNDTPLLALYRFFQQWPAKERITTVMWRKLEKLTESELAMVNAGAGLITFAVAQEVETRRLKRRDEEQAQRTKQLQMERQKRRQLEGMQNIATPPPLDPPVTAAAVLDAAPVVERHWIKRLLGD
jgi:hypothetical protein